MSFFLASSTSWLIGVSSAFASIPKSERSISSVSDIFTEAWGLASCLSSEGVSNTVPKSSKEISSVSIATESSSKSS